MKNSLIIVSLLALISLSCQTNHSLTDMVAPKLEEITEKDGKNYAGVVVYNPHGISQLTKARRNKALMRAREVCNPGNYKITNEVIQKPEERDATYKGNPELIAGGSLMFIEFLCENN